jgi:choline transport protein
MVSSVCLLPFLSIRSHSNHYPGSDAAAHLSEEIKDAGVSVPKAMVGSYLLNGILGLVFLITFLFSITNVDDALNDPSFYPFLWVFKQTLSLGGVNALSSLIVILLFAGTVPLNMSSSRQTWSFARDNGLPFSKWIAYVDPKLQVPSHAVMLSCAIIVILSLINLGSDVAFNAIISLNLVALMFTYSISIGCVLLRRIRHPELLPRARWSLGWAGIPVNIGGLLYSLFAFFWCFWPNTIPVDRQTFNWSVVMFLATGIISIAYYFVIGRKVYTGPVALVKGHRAE